MKKASNKNKKTAFSKQVIEREFLGKFTSEELVLRIIASKLREK